MTSLTDSVSVAVAIVDGASNTMYVPAVFYRYSSRRFVFVGLILANAVQIYNYLNSAHNKRNVSEVERDVYISSVATPPPTVSSSVQECSPERQDVMFKYVDATYDLVGKTELRQYNRFVRAHRRHRGFNLTFGKIGIVEVPSRYRYQILLASNFNLTGFGGIRITIVERDGDTPTRGGSSFLVTSESVSRHLCSYDDRFNGTYFVTCPSPNFGCRNISIRLQYYNFTAYTGNHIPIGKIIWEQCVCNWHESTDAVSLNSRLATWYRSRDTWSLKTFDGQRFYPLAADSFCSCVKEYDRLILIGSSHMRYKAIYVMFRCFDMPQRYLPIDRSLTIGNVQFVFVSKSRDYAHVWTDVLQRKNLTERDMVIFQTGAHDMADFGIRVSGRYWSVSCVFII